MSDSNVHKPLQGDTGTFGTRGHHVIIVALAGLAPVWWVLPEESSISRGLGVILSANIAAHTYIGKLLVFGFTFVLVFGLIPTSFYSPI